MKSFATILMICVISIGFTGCGGGSSASQPTTITALSVEATSSSLATGQTLQFTAIATYNDNSKKDVTSSSTWLTSGSTIATVSSTGLLTALKSGSVTITALMGTKSASMAVTVNPANGSPVSQVSIVVTPSNTSIARGETQQFTATEIFTDGSAIDITNSVTWDSDAHAVATMSATGLATGISAGTANITATSGTVVGTAPLTVTSAVLQSIDIYPDGQSVPIGGQVQYAVTGTFSDGSSQAIANATYSSSDPTIAKINPVTGVATGVAANVNPVTITATVGGLTNTTTLTVIPVTLESIAITPATASLAVGSTTQFALTGTFSDGSTETLTDSVSWTSSAPAIAAIDASTGLVSALTTGPATISASYNGLSASAALVVYLAPTFITVTPALPEIGIGGTQQFTATAVFADGTSQDLTRQVEWISSAATVALVSNAGLATGVSTGTAQITADYHGIRGSATLTVSTAHLTSITVSPATPVMPTRAKIQFSATGVFSDGSTSPLSGVSWHSSSPSRASINGNGLARSKNKVGTATISAALNGATGTMTMAVTSDPVTTATITPVAATIAPGTAQQYVLMGTVDGTQVDLSKSAYWATSNFQDAVISNSGLATGVAAGTVTITATFQGVPYSTTLTVSNASIVSVSVTPAAPSIALGAAQQFTATGTFDDTTTQDITSVSQWTSSNLAIAVVNGTGLATSAGRGAANINATFKTTTGTAVIGTAVLTVN